MDKEHAPVLGGVSGLIVTDGKVLLVRRGNDPYRDHWSLPGGGVEPGESVRDAVRREVLEETGLDVDVGLVAGYREEILGPLEHYVILAFHCTVTGGELCAGDDAAACAYVDPNDIADLLATPGLLDVLRDAGLLR